MINRNILIELQKQGYTNSEIARIFRVSRQRIHQIDKKYKKTGKDGRKKKYRNFGKCNKCSSIATILHHKDFKNQNDDISNLEPLCYKCHHLIHRKQKPIVNYKTIEEATPNIIKDWKENKLSHKQIYSKYNFTYKEIINVIKESKIDKYYK